LYLRGDGFGIPSLQIDGNDVLASYAVTSASMMAARSGQGPRLIEALTYRMGAHTSSDDPSKYRENDEVEYWGARDPIVRYEAYLRGAGVGDEFFTDVATEAEDLAADVRARTLTLQDPPSTKVFAHVYSDPHPLMDAQAAWLAAYEASLDPAVDEAGGGA
jgi:pyruvate dehydrogenase E1 component alpha subunit